MDIFHVKGWRGLVQINIKIFRKKLKILIINLLILATTTNLYNKNNKKKLEISADGLKIQTITPVSFYLLLVQHLLTRTLIFFV